MTRATESRGVPTLIPSADRAILAEIRDLLAQERKDQGDPEFEAALVSPRRVLVNLPGGRQTEYWQVTQENGPYTVFYMPDAGYFSLCVASVLGPIDIGVHGRASDCFGSV